MTFFTDLFNFIVSLFVPTAEVGIVTWFLRLIGLPFCFVVMLAGCSEKTTTAEQLQIVDRLIEYGERHNVAYTVTFDSNGAPGIETGAYGRLNTGIGVRGAFSGNAANARLDPEPKPFKPMAELTEPTE